MSAMEDSSVLCSFEQGVQRVAGGAAAGAQGAEYEILCLRYQAGNIVVVFDIVPCHIFDDGIGHILLIFQCGCDHAGRLVVIHLEKFGANAPALQDLDELFPGLVKASAGDPRRIFPELVKVIGYVHGCATSLFASRQHIPQAFSKTYNRVRLIHNSDVV